MEVILTKTISTYLNLLFVLWTVKSYTKTTSLDPLRPPWVWTSAVAVKAWMDICILEAKAPIRLQLGRPLVWRCPERSVKDLNKNSMFLKQCLSKNMSEKNKYLNLTCFLLTYFWINIVFELNKCWSTLLRQFSWCFEYVWYGLFETDAFQLGVASVAVFPLESHRAKAILLPARLPVLFSEVVAPFLSRIVFQNEMFWAWKLGQLQF